MGHNAVWMELLMRIERTDEGLLAKFTNHCTTRDIWVQQN